MTLSSFEKDWEINFWWFSTVVFSERVVSDTFLMTWPLIRRCILGTIMFSEPVNSKLQITLTTKMDSNDHLLRTSSPYLLLPLHNWPPAGSAGEGEGVVCQYDILGHLTANLSAVHLKHLHSSRWLHRATPFAVCDFCTFLCSQHFTTKYWFWEQGYAM